MFHREKRAEAARHEAEAAWTEQHKALTAVLNAARAGSGYQSDHIVLKKGETEIAHITGVGLLEMRAGQGHYAGRSQGVSIPIGSIHGRSVRYRVGAQKGHFVQGAQEQKVVDQGRLVITTQRIVFLGKSKNSECSFEKLLGIEQQPGQVTISVSNRQKPTVVRYGTALDGWVEMRLGLALAIFRGEAQQFAKIIEQNLQELDAEKPEGLQIGPADSSEESPQLHREPLPPPEARQAEIAKMPPGEVNSTLAKLAEEMKSTSDQMKKVTAETNAAAGDVERLKVLKPEVERLIDLGRRQQGEALALRSRAVEVGLTGEPSTPTQSAAAPPPPPPPWSTTPTPPPPGTPAGWLADPAGRYEHRYWDGSKWTEHVATKGDQSTDFLQ